MNLCLPRSSIAKDYGTQLKLQGCSLEANCPDEACLTRHMAASRMVTCLPSQRYKACSPVLPTNPHLRTRKPAPHVLPCNTREAINIANGSLIHHDRASTSSNGSQSAWRRRRSGADGDGDGFVHNNSRGNGHPVASRRRGCAPVSHKRRWKHPIRWIQHDGSSRYATSSISAAAR